MYLSKENKDITIISGEIQISCPEFWKVAILKNFGKYSKNSMWQSYHSNLLDTQPAILIQKGFQQSWSWEWLFLIIPRVQMECFCKNFQFITDIWEGPNASELVDMFYYKGVLKSFTIYTGEFPVLGSL